MLNVKNGLQAAVLAAIMLITFGIFAISLLLFAYDQAKRIIFPRDYWASEVAKSTKTLNRKIEILKICDGSAKERLASSSEIYINLTNQGWTHKQALEMLKIYQSKIKAECTPQLLQVITSLREYHRVNDALISIKD